MRVWASPARNNGTVNAADALGFRAMNGRLDRKDLRAILTKLLIREKDPGTKDSIRTAIHVFADGPEDDTR
jgi:hypothetical protein